MSIVIREYLGHKNEEVEFNPQVDINEAVGTQPISANSVMVDIEAIHAYPHATRNYTRYMESAIKRSLASWTNPYRRPQILFHNEKDGKIIGRIIAAEYISKDTFSGTPALLLTVNIPDKDGMEQVQDGRLETVSIGIIAHDVRCSICGHNIAEYGPCEDHERGQEYDGEICYWDIYDMEGKECSYVIVPSDIYAKNKRIYKPTGKANLTEGLKGVIDLAIDKNKPLQEQLDAALGENTELTTKVSTLTEETTGLQTKVTELTGANTTLTTENTSLKESNTALNTENEELKGKVATAEAAVTEANTALETEKAMKTTLEEQLMAANANHKNAIIETVLTLRQLARKPEVTAESMQERSVESLGDAIRDLKEELKNGLPKPGSVQDPSLAENNDQNKDDVNKDKKARNINLEEGLEALFNNVVTFKK